LRAGPDHPCNTLIFIFPLAGVLIFSYAAAGLLPSFPTYLVFGGYNFRARQVWVFLYLVWSLCFVQEFSRTPFSGAVRLEKLEETRGFLLHPSCLKGPPKNGFCDGFFLFPQLLGDDGPTFVGW